MEMSMYPKISRENNMTIVRYFLAVNVFIGHFNVLNLTDIPRLTNGFTNIGAFFCLSGFFALITYKEGMGLWNYIKKRGRRLIPPYAAVVLLAAVALVFASSMSAGQYFSSPQLYKYIVANLCYLNFLQPSLPGVFSHNVVDAVNGSLWYMKVEWMLTLSVPLIVWMKNKSRIKMEIILAVIILLSGCYRFYYLTLVHNGELSYDESYRILKQFPGELIYFYSGTLLYLLYNKIKQYRWWILAASAGLGMLSIITPFSDAFLAPAVTSVSVIWVSIIGKWGYAITGKVNFSYGLYLVHFPIMQLFFGLRSVLPVWAMFSATLITTWIISYIMWLVFDSRRMKTV